MMTITEAIAEKITRKITEVVIEVIAEAELAGILIFPKPEPNLK